MPANLPPPVQNYFSGKNARDFTVAVSGFSQSAVVKDESRDHVGPAAIRAWLEETAAQYDDHADARSAASSQSGIEVIAEVSGTFPGSPIPLRFNFTIKDDQIVRLEIEP
ncbi:nuclear transport factor 2 family protein [Kaistia algarum]|uniref:nuclear transport factor 2 family protein n=1 Tax=Kaistia algarum TaxID=2083279 RepID=UPI000CE7E111|nr:nuclear transport factor 2 family protein [Kaistia algarum]MCX5516608.1 nuclear transport factor 2 family protein [Kaistia algarum]PPE77742.1 nuclear transport factor 2 family protein [Kaistia algarum]